MDVAAAEAAGIRDAAARWPLLQYLHARGFTLEEMAEAESRGRLFGLGGDALIRSGPPVYSLRTAADELGRPLAEVTHAWAALGLTVTDVYQVVLSDADLDGLRTWSDVTALLGADAGLGLMRVLGATMARLTEAESSVIRSLTPELDLGRSPGELQTAQAYAAIAEFVPRMGRLLDAAHRQHVQSSRVYFEQVEQNASGAVLCGVGFADLSGFTALSQRLTVPELSSLLSTFATTASEVVHEHGGRLVKMLGDAVMWVNVDANHLVDVAAHLVDHPLAHKAGIDVRAGVAFGPILAMDGDYFGTPVNLAARLVSVARPGQVLATDELCEVLTGWTGSALDPVELRGFDGPVTPFRLQRADRPDVVT